MFAMVLRSVDTCARCEPIFIIPVRCQLIVKNKIKHLTFLRLSHPTNDVES